MNTFYLSLILLLLYYPATRSECENACSGHGRCTIFDMCMCHRNWQGSDCASRTCLFGIALSDVPKGDLDSSGTHDNSDITVAVNSPDYPYGTSELFAGMEDSDHKVLTNSAHYYAECSNAGICNRVTGECECYQGFEGVSCQRMKCPGTPTCSGHGICRTMKQIANTDYAGEYELWDKDMMRGCLCDPGYYGGDCSMRKCKSGIDPLYFDDNYAIQYPMFFFTFMTTSSVYDLTDGQAQPGPGKFNIKVYDEYGQAFFTQPIQAPASCADILKALEDIPHNVIPEGQTNCFHSSFAHANALTSDAFSITYEGLFRKYLSGIRNNYINNEAAIIDAGYAASYTPSRPSDPELTGDMYYLQFFGNAYNFNQPHINIYLGDGSKPSIVSKGGVLVTRTWTNGQQGVGSDLFNHRCADVKMRIVTLDGKTYGVGPFNIFKLFQCLGFADYNEENNLGSREGYYDTGAIETPFAVKLIRGQQEAKDGSMIGIMFYDRYDTTIERQSGERLTDLSKGGAFRFLHPFRPLDDNPFNQYEVYSSSGKLQLIQNRAQAIFDFASNHIYTTNATSLDADDIYDADISCDALYKRNKLGYNASFSKYDSNQFCLDNGDFFFILDPYTTTYNAPFVNMYKAMSLINVNDDGLVEFEDLIDGDGGVTKHTWRRNLILSDINTNWAQGYNSTLGGKFHIYKYVPNPQYTFHYNAECSNRGICNTFDGECECFSGYGGEACHSQDTLSS